MPQNPALPEKRQLGTPWAGCGSTYFLKNECLFLFYVSEYFAYMNDCAPCVYSAHRGQKMALVLLKLKLHMLRSLHVGFGKQIKVLWKITFNNNNF